MFHVKHFFLGSFLLLSACSSQPVIVTERVNVPTFIPVPSTLTLPVTVDLQGATWGGAVGSLSAGLETCNWQLKSISLLSPKPP